MCAGGAKAAPRAVKKGIATPCSSAGRGALVLRAPQLRFVAGRSLSSWVVAAQPMQGPLRPNPGVVPRHAGADDAPCCAVFLAEARWSERGDTLPSGCRSSALGPFDAEFGQIRAEYKRNHLGTFGPKLPYQSWPNWGRLRPTLGRVRLSLGGEFDSSTNLLL